MGSTQNITLRDERCETHGGNLHHDGSCLTWTVLRDVSMERAQQFQRYGTNDDLPDGSGPEARWLLPYTGQSATEIERELRDDYEDHEDDTGTVTWVHLLREELAEAFAESDPIRLRAELIQVAALAVSWVEKLDTRAALGLPAPELPVSDEVPC
jgi:cobalamin-dependent methionine synthase I